MNNNENAVVAPAGVARTTTRTNAVVAPPRPPLLGPRCRRVFARARRALSGQVPLGAARALGRGRGCLHALVHLRRARRVAHHGRRVALPDERGARQVQRALHHPAPAGLVKPSSSRRFIVSPSRRLVSSSLVVSSSRRLAVSSSRHLVVSSSLVLSSSLPLVLSSSLPLFLSSYRPLFLSPSIPPILSSSIPLFLLSSLPCLRLIAMLCLYLMSAFSWAPTQLAH